MLNGANMGPFARVRGRILGDSLCNMVRIRMPSRSSHHLPTAQVTDGWGILFRTTHLGAHCALCPPVPLAPPNCEVAATGCPRAVLAALPATPHLVLAGLMLGGALCPTYPTGSQWFSDPAPSASATLTLTPQ
jgi:hypothetical protein